jgi:peptidoglycan/xylan/chitin deacetylase (PgdA/CDA1 family)
VTARAQAKRLLERTLAWAPIRERLAQVPSDGLLVLAYHNVVTGNGVEYGDASLHLPVETFQQHCDVLASYAEVVALGAEPGASHADPSRPRVAITFDDAYVGAVLNALPMLARRRWPVTVFVSPGMLGGQAFWWDSLLHGGRRSLPDEFRTRALVEGGGRGPDVMAMALANGFESALPPAEALTATERQLSDALRDNPLLTLGAHTWSHVCLNAVDAAEAEREIRESLEWTRRFGAQGIDQLAYPSGAYSADVESIAATAGSSRSYRVDGGWSRPSRDPRQAVPRLNVPAGLSASGLSLRLHGIFAST